MKQYLSLGSALMLGVVHGRHSTQEHSVKVSKTTAHHKTEYYVATNAKKPKEKRYYSPETSVSESDDSNQMTVKINGVPTFPSDKNCNEARNVRHWPANFFCWDTADSRNKACHKPDPL